MAEGTVPAEALPEQPPAVVLDLGSAVIKVRALDNECRRRLTPLICAQSRSSRRARRSWVGRRAENNVVLPARDDRRARRAVCRSVIFITYR